MWLHALHHFFFVNRWGAADAFKINAICKWNISLPYHSGGSNEQNNTTLTDMQHEKVCRNECTQPSKGKLQA